LVSAQAEQVFSICQTIEREDLTDEGKNLVITR